MTSNKWVTFLIVAMGVFMSTLDASIVNISLPTIARYFGVALGGPIEWVIIAYLVVIAAVLLTIGRLSDVVGRKPIWAAGLVVFTVGSALCGAAPSLPLLIAFRVAQGLGAALLFAVSPAIVTGAFPPNERGRALGANAVVVALGTSAGPTIGGVLTEHFTWRWIFYVNVPIGIVGVLIGLRFLPESPLQARSRFDLRGFLLLAVGLGLLLYGLSNLAYDGWSSVLTVSGPTIIAIVLLVAFGVVSWVTPNPLLDLRVFKNRNFWAGNIIIWLSTVGLFGGAFYLPQYLQGLRGLDPFHSGLQLLPQGIAAIVATVFAGVLYNRVGPRALMIGGALVLTLDTYAISTWIGSTTAAYAALTPLLVIRGLALPPLAQTSNTIALQYYLQLNGRGRSVKGKE